MGKIAIKRLLRDEKGYVLTLVLILLVLGGLIIGPLLGLMSTGLISGRVYENSMYLIYAADAGVEDGLWQIRNVELADLFPDYDEYDYYGSWSYNLTDHVNDKAVNVTVENVWMPKGINIPSPGEAKRIIKEGKLIITGSPSLAGESTYEIKISYDPCGGIPAVKTVGIWLPPGFEYDDSCSLEGEDYYSEPTVTPHKGGSAVVWSFSPPVSLADFPASFTFQYEERLDGQIPGAALSWIDTTEGYTWDADVKVYKIISTATDSNTGKQITIESYSNRVELRKLGSAMAGDYHAIGATLMTATATTDPEKRYRNRLFKESSATIDEGDVPSNAIIEAAWLYWSGWIEGSRFPFSATCVEDAKVNRVLFNGIEITAVLDDCQVELTRDSGARNSWSYSCYYDATDMVIAELDPDDKSGTFTLGHANVGEVGSYPLHPTGKTDYPLATPAEKSGSGGYPNKYQWTYAGWSLLIIYSSPETKGHQLYLFDTLRYVSMEDIPVQFSISGFLAPDDTTGSHLTYFVGEGDDHYSGDYIKVNGHQLPLDDDPYEPYEGFNPQNNVFNSKSNSIDEATYKSGIDVDTFDMSECIDSGDISADVILDHGKEIYNLVYIILSFRSEITSGDIMGYLIR